MDRQTAFFVAQVACSLVLVLLTVQTADSDWERFLLVGALGSVGVYVSYVVVPGEVSMPPIIFKATHPVVDKCPFLNSDML